VGDYRKLQVWQRAHQLTLDVYQVTRALPKDELYGLTSQLRRAASSIAANIAEGCGRNGDAELARFLGIALGSANELDYNILLARDLGYLSPSQYEQLTADIHDVTRMLAALIDRLHQPKRPAPKSQEPPATSRTLIADS
jgi:four helix bundle protein